jgi:hypothetical protein
MRTVLAAAAAGALIIGSAAGAMAAPSKGKPAPKSTFQLSSIDIKGHSPINVNPAATTRALVVRSTVRDTNKAAVPNVVTMTVTVAQYDKKRGTEVEDASALIKDFDVPLVLAKPQKTKSAYYKGEVTLEKNAVPAGMTVLICLKSAVQTTLPLDASFTKGPKNKFSKKLSGGDCVRVVNVDPKLTDTKKDDVQS